MTKFTAVFCGCDPLGKSHILITTHFICCIQFAFVLPSTSWNLTLLAPLKVKLLIYEYQQVKITSRNVYFGDPLEGKDLYKKVKHCEMSKIHTKISFLDKNSILVGNYAFSLKSAFLAQHPPFYESHMQLFRLFIGQ